MTILIVSDIVQETPTIRTIRFPGTADATAGQFLMVWIPGIDEIPMSISYTHHGMGITVKSVGEATRALHTLMKGARVGIRGPYGHGFELEGMNRILVLGGGCGSAPLGPILDERKSFHSMKYLVGASTGEELLFLGRAEAAKVDIECCTDDGTKGKHGTVTDLLQEVMARESYDMIVACGPEPMLTKALTIAKQYKTPIQVALERYMRCGVGLCDSCSINGQRVCKDGPVFTQDDLKSMGEFGVSWRNAYGQSIKYEERG